MQKYYIKFSRVIMGVILFIVGFSLGGEDTDILVPIKTLFSNYQPVFDKKVVRQRSFGVLDKSYYDFCKDLGFQESSNNYKAVNRLGYLGKYQFGSSTLRWVGVKNKTEFLNNPLLQERALKALISKNKYLLRNYIKVYNGKFIGGVRISESSLIAAAHLGGAGNVKKFLDSNGRIIFKDANNTAITKYMKKFSNYDLSRIPADRKAKVTL